ncbi:MAG: 2-amino-4-hydroxy-6-hydroxymethyldihydropteridine diphosphokinase [Gammaproteobacteria bacterium]|nr:2-amino-4-hydroxy-6-hydroxymethyldihydropteridine diphosphokinase [Gammaproteobacteria bacterium]NNJ90676.1 2-amino-4-hydroxy-6-hydroxymethyldihydropteridine diphosphokinase [Gammaproteobacteria bacterium]
MAKAFIGLGSNLGKPQQQLEQAIQSLRDIEGITVKTVSSNYISAPVGPEGQGDYINAVVAIETVLSAEQLLDVLQEIENLQGRVRTERWGARTLDMDILLYADEIIDSERLKVPHREIANRNFVLLPLMEITSEEFQIPGQGALLDLLAHCPDNAIKKL